MGSREWRLKNREKFLAQQRRSNARNKAYRRDWQLRKRYGIGLDDYDRMLEAQGGTCAICCSPPPAERMLDVDHCHETGKVRGLLCGSCNKKLAVLDDNAWTTFAYAYLGRALKL